MIKKIILEVKTILSENFGIDECSLNDDLSDSENLAFDSLDRIDFIRLLEQRFKIMINDYQAEDLNTLKDVVKYIYERISEVPEENKRKWWKFY